MPPLKRSLACSSPAISQAIRRFFHMSRCLFVFAWVSLVLLTGPVPGRAEPLLQRNAAARLGLTRAWYAQVGAPRSSGTIAHIRYDAGSLLVQTTRGMLIALDGE